MMLVDNCVKDPWKTPLCAVADILNDVLHKSYYLPFNMQDVLRTGHTKSAARF